MRRIIGGVGRGLVTVGILILLFVAYQLWGTGIYEAREQSRLKAEFAKELAAAKAKAKKDSTPTTTVPPVAPRPTARPSASSRSRRSGSSGRSSRARASRTSGWRPATTP